MTFVTASFFVSDGNPADEEAHVKMKRNDCIEGKSFQFYICLVILFDGTENDNNQFMLF